MADRTRIVSLTTDFGTGSSYVGSLRGVILSVSQEIVIADISHEIRPFQVMEAALVLRDASRWYPPGTAHLVVIDPGVGSARRPIALKAGDHWFVGPDNGAFTPFLAAARVWEIDPSRVAKGPVSPTFHGRDLFAPAAARLALGESPEGFGRPIEDPVRLDWPEPAAAGGGLTGVVLHVDRFGNLITNIDVSTLAGRRPAGVTIGAFRVDAFVRTYADSPDGTIVALVGSGGLLEIAVTRGSAAERLGAGAGETVGVRF